MTTKKIYSPWIKWHGGECPVPPDTLVEVKFRRGDSTSGHSADDYLWHHYGEDHDIVEYCVVTEQAVIQQADLEAAEKLLCANGYTVTPPAKPLTFEDVTPMTEAPEQSVGYWVVHPFYETGVFFSRWRNDLSDQSALRRRMAYLDKEHALVAAKHIFGLKGGEL